jgi:predicted house-cleaning NTP pyrophosphatase (Maf/HAM1 superfamily)
MDIATSCFTCKGIFRGRNPQTVECSVCKNILHRSCLPPLVKNQFNCSNQCVICFVPPKKNATQKKKVLAEKAFDHQRLEKEKENQIIVNKVSPLKNSVIVSDSTLSVESEISNQTSKIVIVSDSTLSVESEISNQTSKIVIVSDSTLSVESEVSNQTSKIEKISFDKRALLQKEFFSKAPCLINNKNLKICFTQYINGYVNYDRGFSVYPNLAKEDFQVLYILVHIE